MNKCFVIQPFSETFNRRYDDIFKPAIDAADCKPYRVDEDLTSRIPIETIEEEIRNSDICFADITTDNPNVWYELGFAFAHCKDVVMVCSNERNSEFPFDIRHRNIIKYDTRSKSDFEELEASIRKRLIAYLEKEEKVKKLSSTKLAEVEGLNDHEMTLLALIFEEQTIPNTNVSLYGLKNDMNKLGYTNFATGTAIRTLQTKGFIVLFDAQNDWNYESYHACTLTSEGEEWLIKNQDKFEFKLKKDDSDKMGFDDMPDDLPF